MAVVATRELEHPVAMGEAAGKAHCAHRRLGAGRDEADALDGRDGVDDLRGELNLSLGRGAERRAVERGLADRLDRLLVGVPEDQRPPRLHPVEQRPPVGRLELRAAAAADEERLLKPHAAHRAHGRVDAARDQAERPMPEIAPN